MRYLLVVLTVLFIPAMSFSAIINVPAEYPTISMAISASTNGDVIRVAPGTYVENIHFAGKAVTVESTMGSSLTFIDGNQVNSVVLFNSGETNASQLDGFTITNGNNTEGGGIRCSSSSPMISNCVIIENTASFGGGMFNSSGSNPIVNNCIFYDNESITSGGGIRNYFSNPIVTNSRFIKNSSTKGAGASNEWSNIEFSNCIFAGNWAEDEGAGLHNALGNVTLTNCTIADNDARFNGGAMFNSDSSPVITNCIVFGNGPDEINNNGSSSPTVTYCDVRGGYPGTGNIDSDPLFASNVYADFHLQYQSPCRDAGTAVGAPSTDFEDDARTNPDIGADEFAVHLHLMGQFYHWGTFAPDAMLHAKITGVPGTQPVGLFLSISLLPAPLNHKWGYFYLGSPFFLIGPLGAMPANGIRGLITTIPSSPPGPYDIYFQVLVGNQLTNLCPLEIR